MKYHILLIEDEDDIRQPLAHYLRKEGYDVCPVGTGEQGLERFSVETFHLILLDIMLPQMSGEMILRTIRQKSNIPIVIISALNDEFIQVDAFTHKADDYVVKPFSLNILTHKISALLRRTYDETDGILSYKDVRLLPNNYEVYYKDEPVELTVKEFEILQIMLQNTGKVYFREELLTILWGYDYFGDARNIDVHIKNIRKKMYPELISTVKGAGYKVEKINE